MNREDIKKKILNQIDNRKEELIKLCSDLVRIPSEDPPGNTTEIAKFLKTFLKEKGIRTKVYEPKRGLQSLVSEQGSENRPRLILNGHLDEFPAGTIGWDFSPFCGDVRDGKILGRGASDMKGGLAASVFVFVLLRELGKEISGKLVLNAVADEEEGGKWGTEWLLDNVPALLGDACLIGEPSGTEALNLGEKGRCRFRVKATGLAGHSVMAIGTINAIATMANAIPTIESLRGMEVQTPPEYADLLKEQKPSYDRIFGNGAGETLDHITVNIGMIRGGENVNIVPELCEVKVDVSLPPGITPEEVKRELDARLRKTGLKNVECEFIKEYPFHRPAMLTPPNEKIAKLAHENIRQVTGKEPKHFITAGGTDGKFFRRKGIPAVVYGPAKFNLGAPNEYVLVEDVVTAAKVHAGIIIDFYDWK